MTLKITGITNIIPLIKALKQMYNPLGLDSYTGSSSGPTLALGDAKRMAECIRDGALLTGVTSDDLLALINALTNSPTLASNMIGVAFDIVENPPTVALR